MSTSKKGPVLGNETIAACRQALATLEGFLGLLHLFEQYDAIEELEGVNSTLSPLMHLRDSEDKRFVYHQISGRLKQYLQIVQQLYSALYTKLELNGQHMFIRKLYPTTGVTWGNTREKCYASLLLAIIRGAWECLLLLKRDGIDWDTTAHHEQMPGIRNVVRHWEILKDEWSRYFKLDWDELRVLLENERLSIEEMVSELGSERTSPWIDTAEMIKLMKANGATSTEDHTIRRWKKKWLAESQPGTNNQCFRFNLAMLESLRIQYPASWDELKP